jgi:Ca-activated chloride channel family protein
VQINKTDPKRVVIGYQANNIIPSQDFKLFFHPTNSDVGISLLSYKPTDSDEGWFMFLASPSIENKNTQRIAKNVIITIDISGSMNGVKIEQAKKAASFIINNLNKDDKFNIVTYQGIVEVYSREMLSCSAENVKNALSFITNLSAGGGTNINEALQRAMGITGDTERPGYLLFLTDGLPTVGETNEMNIAKNCLTANKNKTRVFSFGVGYDVNARLLDRISEQNSGMSAYVKPGENLEVCLSEFYRSIQSPVLTDITVAFAIDGSKAYDGSFAVFKVVPEMTATFSVSGIKEVYPSTVPDMFEGGQIELFGKYVQHGKTKVTITGVANGKKQTYTYDVEFADKGEGFEYKQIEKIWATKKIGFLINQIDLNGEKEELVTSLVELSKKYGILTPYTSFLAREDIDIYDVRQNTTTTTMNLEKLDNVSGQSGVAQRSYKQQLKNERMATENEDVMSVTAAGEVHVTSTVKNIGGRAFYLRNGIWIDGTLNETQEKNAVTVKQFSDKYFEIAKNNSVDLNQYLSVDEEIVINLNGDAYKIVKE